MSTTGSREHPHSPELAESSTSSGEPPTSSALAALEIFGERLDSAVRYAARLASDGVTRGLIGPREVPRLWDRHLLNCAVLQELIEREGRVLDVGSGAGLPGVVLAIVRPDVQVTLLEPMARRVAFLEALVAELELPNLLVLRGRAEEQVGKLHFPVVTARAVAPLDRLAKWCLPLLEVNGSLMAMKGSSVAEELAAHASAIRAAGGDDVTVKVCGAEILAQPTTVVEIVRRRSTTRGGRRSR